MNFKYKVRDNSGQIISGVGIAETRQSLIRDLKNAGLVPIAVIPVRSAEGKTPGDETGGRLVRETPSFLDRSWGRIVKDDELLLFTRDLYSLVHAGVPLVSGIRDIAEQTKNRSFRHVLNRVCDDINAGSKLSEALARHPDAFGAFYSSSVSAGEEAGQLENILQRLIENLDHDIETRLIIQNATRYPMIVLCFLGLAFSLIVTVVIPKIAVVYDRFSTTLPLPTRILIAVGNFFQNHGFLVLIIGMMTGAALFFFGKTARGQWFFDSAALKMPVFGDLAQKASLSKFASTLQTLYGSGIVLTDALGITAKVVGNRVIRKAVLGAEESMKAGLSLSEALKANHLFPPMVLRIVMTGEKTGNLEDMLGEITAHYDREIRYKAKTIGTFIEPMLTLFLGAMILILALGVFLPMWNVIRLFRH